MDFETILPNLKLGKLARRSSWESGVCVGLFTPTSSGFMKFGRYDRGSSCSTWNDPMITADQMADDWEIVPEVTRTIELHPDVKAVLNGVAGHFQRIDPDFHNGRAAAVGQLMNATVDITTIFGHLANFPEAPPEYVVVLLNSAAVKLIAALVTFTGRETKK